MFVSVCHLYYFCGFLVVFAVVVLVLCLRLWLLSKGMSRHLRVMNLESCP
ncbi:hypothetical protein HanHA300_Chr15g0564011 [Helianthus annuus]|nr:hypothetical protein HanHA300_Chr15g0564011 [Helianthus annuus]KAJ0472996.1 hypothetical protein HanHA89_Chr15g0613311 [Helianthus annuus]KAJ0648599.1 hypothetical protein HanLR1_Chr15g0574691 [Helianthus annuus]